MYFYVRCVSCRMDCCYLCVLLVFRSARGAWMLFCFPVWLPARLHGWGRSEAIRDRHPGRARAVCDVLLAFTDATTRYAGPFRRRPRRAHLRTHNNA